MYSVVNFFHQLVKRVKANGVRPAMDPYEIRRLGVFNLLNFFALVSGIIIPVAAVLNSGYLPPLAWIVACSPAIVSGVVLMANHRGQIKFAMMWYFIMYPFFTALVYAGSIDVGIELFFVFYGVLAVFFLQNLKSIFVAISCSIAGYIFIYLIHKDYQFVMRDINYGFFVFNHLLAVCFIFLGLFLIKKENTEYQFEIVENNRSLHRKNIEIGLQTAEIAAKATQLEAQTVQLTELNAVKNRLFSIVSHDLRTPIYGLRNLFKNMQQYDLPGNEIKLLVPDIVNDLNYTTGLMENLLQWAKSQMQGSNINPQLIDITQMIEDIKKVLRLQATNKRIYLEAVVSEPVYIFADKDMIDLVLRNLLSNAIKFTPENGKVSVEVDVKDELVEVQVKDTGMGISKENIQLLFGDTYFTTKGTANEAGTGLGLLLCKDFLQKNNGQISVKSEPGKGSIFSFVLPKA